MAVTEERFHLAADAEGARVAASALFEGVRQELRSALPASADVQHVGATAIPGCITKGDLDIVVRVDDADFTAAEAHLAARFERNEGSIRTRDFAAFVDSTTRPPLGVQLTVRGGRFDVFHRFAAILRGDPSLVERYNTLKVRFDGRPMPAYRMAKSAFIEDILAGSLTESPTKTI